MVSTGVVAAMMSTSVSGKVIGMWMPVMLFFYMGFEHSIVNMFLFPSGSMLGGDLLDQRLPGVNQIPTVLGNLVGGLTFVGLTLFATARAPASPTARRSATCAVCPRGKAPQRMTTVAGYQSASSKRTTPRMLLPSSMSW